MWGGGTPTARRFPRRPEVLQTKDLRGVEDTGRRAPLLAFLSSRSLDGRRRGHARSPHDGCPHSGDRWPRLLVPAAWREGVFPNRRQCLADCERCKPPSGMPDRHQSQSQQLRALRPRPAAGQLGDLGLMAQLEGGARGGGKNRIERGCIPDSQLSAFNATALDGTANWFSGSDGKRPPALAASAPAGKQRCDGQRPMPIEATQTPIPCPAIVFSLPACKTGSIQGDGFSWWDPLLSSLFRLPREALATRGTRPGQSVSATGASSAIGVDPARAVHTARASTSSACPSTSAPTRLTYNHWTRMPSGQHSEREKDAIRHPGPWEETTDSLGPGNTSLANGRV